MEQPLRHLEDGGPIYYESDFDAFIAEPFNMVSAAIFIPIAIYWLIRNERREIPSRFMRFSAILLLIGGTGGTIYHGFRISTIALYMDWMPILILCLAVSAYFLYRTFSGIKWAVIGSIGLFAAMAFLTSLVPPKYGVNIGYAVMALYVLIPTILILKKTGWHNALYIALAFISFGLALFFRIFDQDGLLQMGTHFLWHVFGAVSTYFMFFYVYHLQLKRSSIEN